MPYAPNIPQANEDARQDLQDNEDPRRILPDSEDASEEMPAFHRHEPASARRKRLRKRSEIGTSNEASPVHVFQEAGLKALKDPSVVRRESTSRQEPPREIHRQNLRGALVTSAVSRTARFISA